MKNQVLVQSIAVILGIILFSIASTFVAFAQSQASPSNDIWTNLDAPIKVIAGTVAIVVALLGLPVAFLQTRKTLVEIRKIELEAQEIQKKVSENFGDRETGYRIVFDNADGNVVNITADPRLLGPLLILLNFIIAFVILGLGAFGLGVFPLSDALRNGILFVAASILFIPILVAATRSQKSLKQNQDIDRPH